MHTKSLLKAMSIVELIAENVCLSLEQLHIITDIPKPTLKRILDDLEELGWLYRRLADKQYVLLKDIANNKRTEYEAARIVAEPLKRLYSETGLPSDFSIIKDGYLVTIESSLGLSGFRKVSKKVIGVTPSPWLSAAGRSYLSFNHKFAQEEIYIDTNKKESILKSIEEEKKCGFFKRVPGSWEYDFEKPFDIRAVSLPIIKNDIFIGCLSLYWDGNIKLASSIIDRNISLMTKYSEIIKNTILEK